MSVGTYTLQPGASKSAEAISLAYTGVHGASKSVETTPPGYEVALRALQEQARVLNARNGDYLLMDCEYLPAIEHLRTHPSLLSAVSPRLINDKEFILSVASSLPHLFKLFPNQYKRNLLIIATVIEKLPAAFQSAADSVRSNPADVIDFLDRNIPIFEFATEACKQNQDVQIAELQRKVRACTPRSHVVVEDPD